MNINNQITRKQHYVWQKYLRPWLTEGKLWWERKGMTRNTDTDSILRLKDTYKIERLNQNEQLLLEKMFFEDKRVRVNELNQKWLEYFRVFNTLEDISTKESSLEIVDESRIQFGEDIISATENMGSKSLDKILKGDIHFFNNENNEDDCDDTIDFLYFCCYQYFRTKKMRDRIINIMASDEVIKRMGENFKTSIDWSKIMTQGIHGLVTKVAYGMYVSHTKFYLTLLETTDSEFVTSDQPIFNIKETAIENKIPDEFELYFAISKNLALVITDKIVSNEKKLLTNEEVDFFINLVRKNTHEFFIGSS
ncbi:MAG: DUF4238 domain-containing protein [Acholeplasmataceae bacterium]|jgi:hypothetical protein|nr:DUF4238 domain-containing protein [Acholeplasmataceae bacterium]